MVPNCGPKTRVSGRRPPDGEKEDVDERDSGAVRFLAVSKYFSRYTLGGGSVLPERDGVGDGGAAPQLSRTDTIRFQGMNGFSGDGS